MGWTATEVGIDGAMALPSAGGQRRTSNKAAQEWHK